MVRDGYLYGGAFILVGLLLAWLTNPVWAVLPFLIAFFLLWFFRDPERQIPQDTGAVVSPGDGKVTAIVPVSTAEGNYTRISIFLSVFDVHVNRSPISGTVSAVRYKRGKFLDARSPHCSELNEQNAVTVEGDGHSVVFKQIAGLLARRIVFNPRVGDRLERGQRVGLIKFGSRVDVVLAGACTLNVQIGDRVQGGSSIVAYLPVAKELAGTGTLSAVERSR